jgi:hypothetical protein
MAADFELFWDPNCNADMDLEGYYIYYKEDASVVDDPNGAFQEYVALSDAGFDPDNPSFPIPGLLDDVRYCFAVAAWYGNEESGLSNEVCGINGTYASEPDPDPVGPQISKTNWQLVYVDSEELEALDGAAVNAFDGDPDTMWHTLLSAGPAPAHPHEIIIDLGDTYDLDGFIYETYQVDGRIIDYAFFVGTGGSGPWAEPVASGLLANDATVKSVSFAETTGRYIRLVAFSEPNGNPWTTAAEIGVTGGLQVLPNELPVANAGGPYEATDTDDSGWEEVTLDGSASFDGDGTIMNYLWSEAGVLIGTGVNPTLSFAVGTHTVTLTVTDNENATHVNDTTVIVNPAPLNEPPIANAGGPYEATDTDDSGWEEVTLDGSASFDGDGTIINYLWYEAGVLIGTGVNPPLSFAVGTHTVTLTVSDDDNAVHANNTTVIVNSNPANAPPDGSIDAPAGNPTIYVGESVNFSGIGSDPDGDTRLSYRWEFGDGSGIADYTIDDYPGDIIFENTGIFTVTFTVTDSEGTADPTPDTRVITVVEQSQVSGPIAKTDWQLVYADSEELVAFDGAATNAFDGDPSTYWHTQWSGGTDDPGHPHEIIIDLGHTYDLDGFSYEPYKRGGRIVDYAFFVGSDSDGPWTSVASGAFSNGASVKTVSFAVTSGRYIRLVAYSEAKGKPWTSAVEIGVTGTQQP